MEHWSQYWNTPGVLNSFAEGSANQGYEGQLQKLWNEQFESLKSTAKLLDVASGNGALALLAVDFAATEKKRFKVSAADAASIDPVAQFEKQPEIAKKLKKVDFHSKTPLEKLGLEDGSFDFVMSQFGFEYAKPEKAIPEILRVLNAKGRFVAIAHDKASDITKACEQGAEVIDQVLHHSPIFPQTEVILDLAEQGLPQLGDAKWQEYKVYRVLRNTVLWSVAQIRSQFPAAHHKPWVDDVEQRIVSVFNHLNTQRLPDMKRFLRFHYEQLLQHQLRISEQAKVALNEKSVKALEKVAKKHDAKFTAEAVELEEGTKVWVIEITK